MIASVHSESHRVRLGISRPAGGAGRERDLAGNRDHRVRVTALSQAYSADAPNTPSDGGFLVPWDPAGPSGKGTPLQTPRHRLTEARPDRIACVLSATGSGVSINAVIKQTSHMYKSLSKSRCHSEMKLWGDSHWLPLPCPAPRCPGG